MELKERSKKGWVFTMVDYDHVPLLCEKARKLHESHLQSGRSANSIYQVDPHALMPALSARVRHDHLPNSERRQNSGHSDQRQVGAVVDSWIGRRKRREK